MGLLERSKSLRRRDLSNTADCGQNGFVTHARPTRKPSLLRRRSSVALKPRFEHQNPSRRPKTAEQDCCDSHRRYEDVMPFAAGQDVFNFPTPSPQLSSFPSVVTPKSNNLSSFPSHLDLTQCSTPIGLAIGSPSQMPTWGRSYTADYIQNMKTPTHPSELLYSTTRQHVEASSSEIPLRRQKTWKRFGELFRRKSSKRNPNTRDRSQELNAPETGNSGHPFSEISTDAAFHTSSTANGNAGEQARHSRSSSQRHVARWQARAEADREIFHPTGEMGFRRTPSMVMQDSPLLSSNSCASPTLSSDNHSKSSMSNRNALSTPQLDVEIPTIELDRYSVMFGKVLTPQQSLLERRMTRLKSTDQERPKDSVFSSTSRIVPQRSLSTLQTPLDSANASLTPERKLTGASRLRSGLQRSNTAPGGMSPARAHFINSLPTVNDEPVSPVSTFSTMQEDKSLPCTPISFADDDSIVVSSCDKSRPWLPQKEPSWEMLQKAATGHPPVTARSQDGRQVAHASSGKDADEQIVRISIARQVSVSKARQKIQQAAENKQQVQSLRPRVVEVNKNGALRKSTVVVIEED